MTRELWNRGMGERNSLLTYGVKRWCVRAPLAAPEPDNGAVMIARIGWSSDAHAQPDVIQTRDPGNEHDDGMSSDNRL